MSDKEGRIRQRAYEIWQRGREIDAEDENGSGDVVERTIEETASTAGPQGASSLDQPDAGIGTEPTPKTAGAPMPGPDTSRSRVANRD